MELKENRADRMHTVKKSSNCFHPLGLLADQGRNSGYHAPSECPGASSLLSKGSRSHAAVHVPRGGSAKAQLSLTQLLTWINPENHFVFPKGKRGDLLRH